jgi:hypothetical protein
MAMAEALADCGPEFDVKSLREHKGRFPSYEEFEVRSSNLVLLPVENPRVAVQMPQLQKPLSSIF